MANQGIDACVQAFQNALKDTYVATDSKSLFENEKNYFSSNQFISDYESGKWNGDIFGVADGDPFELQAGSSSDSLKQWQSSLQNVTTITLDNRSYSTLAVSTGNAEMAKQFNECVQSNQNYGPTISVDDSGDGVTLKITVGYRTLGNDPIPNIDSVQVIGVTDVDIQNIISHVLPVNQTFAADGKAFYATRLPNKVFGIAVNASNGTSAAMTMDPVDANGALSGVAISTIISSILNYQDFCEVNGFSSNIVSTDKTSAQKAIWVPCDGRLVGDSKYGQNGKRQNAPDLRGSFLRCVNDFEVANSGPLNQNQLCPDPVQAGVFQSDGVGPHHHAFTYPSFTPFDADGARPGGFSVAKSLDSSENTSNENIDFAKETRPKNIPVFHYIKIN